MLCFELIAWSCSLSTLLKSLLLQPDLKLQLLHLDELLSHLDVKSLNFLEHQEILLLQVKNFFFLVFLYKVHLSNNLL
jgi:hypothetical protein